MLKLKVEEKLLESITPDRETTYHGDMPEHCMLTKYAHACIHTDRQTDIDCTLFRMVVIECVAR